MIWTEPMVWSFPERRSKKKFSVSACNTPSLETDGLLWETDKAFPRNRFRRSPGGNWKPKGHFWKPGWKPRFSKIENMETDPGKAKI
jgi:hypothetical protein